MALPDPWTVHEANTRELTWLLDEIVAGDLPAVVLDRATAERWLVRLIGVLMLLQERHRVDGRGRCVICWAVPRTWWWPWLRRSTCTVHTALSLYLRQPEFVLAALTDTGTARRAS